MMSGQVTGCLCGPRIYEYEGWMFEFHCFCGPWPLKKDGELRARAGREFWGAFTRWEKDKRREKYRVGGGCQRIGGN